MLTGSGYNYESLWNNFKISWKQLLQNFVTQTNKFQSHHSICTKSLWWSDSGLLLLIWNTELNEAKAVAWFTMVSQQSCITCESHYSQKNPGCFSCSIALHGPVCSLWEKFRNEIFLSACPSNFCLHVHGLVCLFTLVGGVCGPSSENPANVECMTIGQCTKDIIGHLTFCKVKDNDGVDSESKFLLAPAAKVSHIIYSRP